jgi:type IV pilus assembly protein PilW
MLNESSRHLPRRRQRGLSIVELMVGVTIGLLVVAASTLVVTTQLVENRRLIVETQIQQDLRASADIVTRELRRAGAWTASSASAPPGAAAVWSYANTSVACSVYSTLSPSSGSSSEVDYRYLRPNSSGMPSLGFKLDSSTGVGILRYSLAAAGAASAPSDTCTPPIAPNNWQDLTDPATVNVTSFTVTPQNGTPVQIPCPKTCPANPLHLGDLTYCWPTISVRQLLVTIQGQAVSDPTVTRSISIQVRLRNDWVQFNNPSSATTSCPT